MLLIDGEGTIELDGGLLQETGSLFDQLDGTEGVLDPAFAVNADGHENERIIVAQWLRANADKCRILESEGSDGMYMPADRIPGLAELCGVLTSLAISELGPTVHNVDEDKMA